MANSFNLQLPEEGDDLCCICQDVLSCGQAYRLPECHHRFHTNCIVTWFRHRPSSRDDWIPDGACPYCGNRGVNHVEKKRRWYRTSATKCEYSASRIKLMREEMKKPNAHKELKRLFKRLNTQKEELKTVKQDLLNYRTNLKTETVNYREANKKLADFSSSKWRKKRTINAVENAIINFPIIPIIIPTKVSIE